ncbi:glyceraldehyde dehydrogenase subunit alpha [Carboxydochorda subterranea]|uniref:Glyceraldehyde dehydrogenase subunit alpha n=1 Tax=Carboxydichorda subterranea TaxID=3109565 RepID=A0ABZ1BX35_9FIRM|nr:glyceraldehyde dehydrogenase subunit alpha [Limnochorda sp. L945t]WRP17366.1 glyceraldehyde dehydrogenase subunit alpha [Limnochorda sp. L945t]
MATIFGTAIRRREDPRLITGRATYTDDIRLPGMVYAAFLRSPHAHARIKRIDTSRARALPGVLAVFTGMDVAGKLGNIPTAWLVPNSDLKTPAHPPLATEKVRYVGDGVAMVVAEDRYTARDAVELIEVEYEVLPAVVDQEKAVQDGAPQVHDDVPRNIAFVWRAGGGDPDRAIQEAEVVVRQRIRNHRLIPSAMETRGAVAQFNPASGEMTVWLTSQNPHIHRVLMSGVLGIPEHKLRIVAPEVGGGFGSKIPFYPDEALVAFAARQLGRPVKWSEERRENYVATTHGRDHIQDVVLAGRRDGTLTAIKVKALANLGAYLSTAAPGVPTILFGLMLQGAYRIPNVGVEVVGVLTNTTPIDAYRGAGRPEATYIIERMVDLFAREVGMDPAEVRRRNFIPSDAFPYNVPTGLTYDSGNYAGAFDKALEAVDYEGLRRQQQELRKQGRYLGIGLASYVEICGLGPSQVAGAVGFQGGLWDSALVRVHPTGKVTVYTGTSPHGQGEETTFAQIVAQELGIPVDDIEVVHGDTGSISMGWGTYGSRTTPVGGSAVALAARRVVEKARKVAAHLLEAAEQDIVFEDGRFYVKGSADRSRSFQEVALQAYLAWNLPPDIEPSLEASAFYDPANFVYPFGTHVAVVEVDAATGRVKLLRYMAVDDCGRVINPMIVDGQVHGGVVQGIGQALWEEAVYDENGQLLTGSMLDYALPRAHMVLPIETDRTETPAPQNPLGVKGVGETGTIAATPAVVNAVLDALQPLGVRYLDMPLIPQKIWAAIHRQ